MRGHGHPNLHRLLRRVRLRLLIARATESAGAGLLAGSALAALLSPVFLLQGQPFGRFAVGLLGAGALGGLVWAIIRRPSILQAAFEIDQQMNLNDLLATAAAAEASTDRWSETVAAIAEHRSATIGTTGLTFGRRSKRFWGLVGLAPVTLLTLALLFQPSAEVKSPAVASAKPATPGLHDRPANPLLLATNQQRTRPPEQNQDEPGKGSTQVDTGTTASTPPKVDPGSRDVPSDPRNTSAGDPTAKGPGMSSTPRPTPNGVLPDLTGTNANPTKPEASHTAGAGVGRSGVGAENGVKAGTGVTGGSTTPPRPPARWETTQWSADAEAARAALSAGQVSPAYRDLVRKYFERD